MMTDETPHQPEIVPMEPADAPAVGRLFQMTFPEAIFARLGARFAARFMSWIHQEEHSRVWVARSESGKVVGAIAGTLDRPAVYGRIVRMNRAPIALSVLVRLCRPAVLSWICRAVRDRLRPPPGTQRDVPRPPAELLVIVVTQEAKGTGLAQRLVQVMESQFHAWGFAGVYTILTLSTNTRANAFYTRLGAKLAAKVPTRGMLVHEYHKRIDADG